MARVSTKTDYEHITIPDNIEIMGDILPVRELRGDGSDKIIRGEDIAFLLEASSEVNNAIGIGKMPIHVQSAPGWSDMHLVNPSFRDAVKKYLSAVPPIHHERVDTTINGEVYSTWPAFDDLHLSANDLDLVPEVPKALKIEDVRREFRNLQKFKFCECALPYTKTDFTCEHSFSTTGKYDENPPVEATFSTWYHAVSDHWRYQGEISGGSYEYELENVTSDVEMAGASALYKTVYPYFRVETVKYVQKEEDGPLESDNGIRNWAIRVPCFIRGNKLVIYGTDIIGACERIKGAAGITNFDSSWWQCQYSVSCYGLSLDLTVAELRDHSRIDDLGWNG